MCDVGIYDDSRCTYITWCLLSSKWNKLQQYTKKNTTFSNWHHSKLSEKHFSYTFFHAIHETNYCAFLFFVLFNNFLGSRRATLRISRWPRPGTKCFTGPSKKKFGSSLTGPSKKIFGSSLIEPSKHKNFGSSLIGPSKFFLLMVHWTMKDKS